MIDRTPRMYGAFHGAMARMVPYGSEYTSALVPSAEVVGMVPVMEEVRPATSRMISRASMRLNPAQAGAAPVSSTMAEENSSLRSLRSWAALRKMSRFFGGGRRFQAG